MELPISIMELHFSIMELPIPIMEIQLLFSGSNADDMSTIQEPDPQPYKNPYAMTKAKSTPSPSKKKLIAGQDQLGSS